MKKEKKSKLSFEKNSVYELNTNEKKSIAAAGESSIVCDLYGLYLTLQNGAGQTKTAGTGASKASKVTG